MAAARKIDLRLTNGCYTSCRLRRGSRCAIVTRSDWRFGMDLDKGIPFCGGRPAAYFADEIHPEDLTKFEAKKGDSAYTTLWEALAILVALKCWSRKLSQTTRFEIRSEVGK